MDRARLIVADLEGLPIDQDACDIIQTSVKEVIPECVFRIALSNSNCWMLEMIHSKWPMPLCVCWCRNIGKSGVEILDIKTHLTFRRAGLATRLIDSLKSNPNIGIIFSQMATTAGEALVKKAGFVESALGWQWTRGEEKPKRKSKRTIKRLS